VSLDCGAIAMQHIRNSVYRGSAVAVRWTESHGLTLPSRFTAGYRITLADGEQSDWCHFTDLAFDTPDHAASFALARAQQVLDARCLRPHKSISDADEVKVVETPVHKSESR